MSESKFFPDHAMVLAAGLGKRMRAYDDSVPKPLVRVAGKPLVDWALDLLKASKIPEAVVNISYMADLMAAHLAERKEPTLTLSREDNQLLETGGGIRKALPHLGSKPFFVLNGDVIVTDGPATPLLERMAARWNEKEMEALLLLVPTEAATGYHGQGDFHLSEDGRLRRRQEGETAPYVFTGVQLLHPDFFTPAPQDPNEPFSMNLLYNHEKSEDGWLNSRIRGIRHDGMWLHVGDGEGVKQAEAKLKQAALAV